MDLKFPTLKNKQVAIIEEVFNAMLKKNPSWVLDDLVEVRWDVFHRVSSLYQMRSGTNSYGDFYNNTDGGKARTAVVSRLVALEKDRRAEATRKAGEAAKAAHDAAKAKDQANKEAAINMEKEHYNNLSEAHELLEETVNKQSGFMEKYSWLLVIAGVIVGALLLKKILKRKK